MPRRARIGFLGAGTGIVLLAVTWYVAHYVGFVRRADLNILLGFIGLNRPGLNRLTDHIASLCDPGHFLVLAAIPVIVALARGRRAVAVMIVVVLLGANETTQLLKPLLAGPRDPVPWYGGLGTASWPSGHATAAMSLALCTVIAAPARRRPAVAAAMAAFALAVVYSFLELGWHYPSDVLGGFLVAGTWTMLGVALLSLHQARRTAAPPERARRAPTVSIGEALTPVGLMALLGAGAAALILLARPHPVIVYARAHETFVLGAGAIGALTLALAAGLTLFLRRG